MRGGWFAVLTVAACVSPTIIADVSQQAMPAVVAPPRPGLEPIAFPGLETLDEAVANHLREARLAFEKTASRGSSRDLGEAYGNLGRVFHAYEFFDAADSCYRNAASLRPTVTWLHLRAYLYQQTGRFEEAAPLYLAARRAAADDDAATVHLGEAYLGLGRLADARAEFQSILARYPAAANAGLGEVALREERYQDAIRHFEAALGRIPDASSLQYPLAMAYRGLGRLEEARAHLNRRGPGAVRVADPIVDLLPTLVRGERGFVMQGRRAYEAGQFQAAVEAFRKAVDAAPSSVTARVNLGLALAQRGDAAGAIEHFTAAVRLDPVNAAAHASLGQLFARQGRDREAVDHLRAAFDQAPGDAQVIADLTGALVRLARPDEAIAVLTKARSMDPDDEGLVLSLAILLADRQRYRDAVGVLEDGHRQFADRTPTATTLARLLASSPDRSLRDGQRALGLAMAVHDREPTPVHRETVALALSELGRCDEAADWMRRAVDEAVRAKDNAEAARLKGESARYAQRPCRP
jgi:tetratricopeptide (TPR) repeat protein